MLSLLRHFYHKRFQRVTLSLCTMLVASLSLSAAEPKACNASPVFAFSQALYFQRYENASQLLPTIKRERSAELALFLAQVLHWKKAYDTQNSQRQSEALNEIDWLINNIESTIELVPAYQTELTAGNIMMHAARLNLMMGRVIRAAKLAKRGKQLLNNILNQNPNEANAFLAAGLYQYYAGNDEPGFVWVKRWFSLRGDEKKGRDFIERAMQQSPDYAFEAARSLLMELDWNRHDICRYPQLFDDEKPDKTQPLAISQLQITRNLYCGQTHDTTQSLRQIQPRLEGVDPQTLRWFDDASLYGLAQAGDVAQLMDRKEAIDDQSTTLKYLRVQFALAKALDVKGEHTRAKTLYEMLAESKLADDYKNLAQRYMLEPYRAPIPIRSNNSFVVCRDD